MEIYKDMKIRVLGSSGAELLEHKATSFLINGNTLLDAGTIVSSLTLEEQAKIDNIIISHMHLDHIKDIPFLADNVIGRGKTINIISTPFVLEGLKNHIFNNLVWPDFTKLPDAKLPVIRYVPLDAGCELTLDSIKIKPIAVNHTVEALGYIIKDENSAFVYTGDTGTTDEIWEEAGKETNLKFVIAEVSFPNNMQRIANLSKHLTSHDLAGELKKLGRTVHQIYVTHLKPQYLDVIKKELTEAGISCPNISILKTNDVIEF